MNTAYGYTNVESHTAALPFPIYDIGIMDNYAGLIDDPGVYRVDNVTCTNNAQEKVEYHARDIKDLNGVMVDILHPAPVNFNEEFGIKWEGILVTTDDSDPTFELDEPIRCTISFKAPKSGTVTAQHLNEALGRTLSYLIKEDGSSRLAELMKKSCRPTKN